MVNKSALLFSGGLDSFIAYHYLTLKHKLDIDLVYFELGHQYEKMETDRILILRNKEAIPFVRKTKVLNLGDIEEEDANIPLRNMFMATALAAFGYNRIFLIVQQGETDLPDRSRTFFALLNRTLRVGIANQRISIDSPFWEMTKVDMVHWYINCKLPIDFLKDTWSCYSPNGELPCGTCSACFRRWIAMEYNGIMEEHFNPPWESALVSQYIGRMQNGEYDPKRTKQTMQVLRRYGRI